LVVPFEVLDALAELAGRFVIEADESVGLLESLIHVNPVLGMADVNVSQQTFSHELKFPPEAFNQHAGVSFDFLKPVIYLREALIVTVKTLLNTVETLINLIESFVEILNEFLIHTASAPTKLN